MARKQCRIGVMFSTTGSYSVVARSMLNGALLAFQENAEASGAVALEPVVVNPSGDYIDTPWDAPDEVGYAFQSYNGGSLGAFGELEYHTPAIGGNSGRDSCRDTSQLWAFSGPPTLIRKIAGHLLGEESLPAAE